MSSPIQAISNATRLRPSSLAFVVALAGAACGAPKAAPVSPASTSLATTAAQAPSGSSLARSEFATANGVKQHYLVAGNGGTPVVLLHGFAETSRMWTPLFEPLSK